MEKGWQKEVIIALDKFNPHKLPVDVHLRILVSEDRILIEYQSMAWREVGPMGHWEHEDHEQRAEIKKNEFKAYSEFIDNILTFLRKLDRIPWYGRITLESDEELSDIRKYLTGKIPRNILS